MKIRKLWTKKFYNIGPRSRRQKEGGPETDPDPVRTIVDFRSPISRLEKLFSKLRKNENSFEHFTQVEIL
jgi:hypothetical protein